MKILLVGDAHSDLDYSRAASRLAAERGIDTVVQLGDLEYSPQTMTGRSFIESLGDASAEFAVRWCWLHGNHDDWNSLQDAATDWRSDEGFVPIADRIFYIPQGHRWMWRSHRFASLGGAVSLDWATRTEGFDWWPKGETIGADDVAHVGAERVDVFLSHDAPSSSPLEYSGTADREDVRRALLLRSTLQGVIERTHPLIVFHGHWHERYTFEMSMVSQPGNVAVVSRIEGLASNAEPIDQALMILDLDPHTDGVELELSRPGDTSEIRLRDGVWCQ